MLPLKTATKRHAYIYKRTHRPAQYIVRSITKPINIHCLNRSWSGLFYRVRIKCAFFKKLCNFRELLFFNQNYFHVDVDVDAFDRGL